MTDWVYNAPDETPTLGPQIVAIVLASTGLSLVIVCLRMYVRVVVISAIGADDWAIISSWFGICGYSVTAILQTKWGLGIAQLEDMPPENMRNFLLIEYIGSPFYVVCLFGFKLSLLMSYLRFIPFGICNLGTKIMAVVVVVAHIAFVLGFILSCNPVAKFWDNSITQGSCIGLPFYTAFSVLTILFDIIILLLPLPNFIKLQIPRRKKFVILGLFTLGIFITAVQVIRFHTIQTLTNLVDSAKPITWSIVEGNMGIITTCIPTLAPLVKYFSDRSRLGGTSSGRGGTRSQSYALTSFRSGLRDGGIRKTELAVRTSNRSMVNERGTSEDNLTGNNF